MFKCMSGQSSFKRGMVLQVHPESTGLLLCAQLVLTLRLMRSAAMLPMRWFLAIVQALCSTCSKSCSHSAMLPYLTELTCMSFSYQNAVVILHAVLRCVLPHPTHSSALPACMGLRPWRSGGLWSCPAASEQGRSLLSTFKLGCCWKAVAPR